MNWSDCDPQSKMSQKWQPYPGYRESGVQWLERLPTHWEVWRLKHVCTSSAIYGANEPPGNYKDDGVRFLRTSDIDDTGNLRNDGAIYVDRDLAQDYLLSDGDLLLSRSGTIGRSFVYRGDRCGQCAYAGYLVRFVLGARMSPEYAFYFTKSVGFAHWLAATVIQSTIGNVSGQKYGNILLPIPPPTNKPGLLRSWTERPQRSTRSYPPKSGR